jgi:hypothetical protein
MNSQNKKTIEAKGVRQQPKPYAAQSQKKAAGGPPSPTSSQSRRQPVAPPAYRPQLTPRCLQPKASAKQQPPAGRPAKPTGDSVPRSGHSVQMKREPVVRRPPSSNGVVQRAEDLRRKLGQHVTAQDDDCVICMEPLGGDRIRLICGHELHHSCLDNSIIGALDNLNDLGYPKPKEYEAWYQCPLCKRKHTNLQLHSRFNLFSKRPDKGGGSGGGSGTGTGTGSGVTVG